MTRGKTDDRLFYVVSPLLFLVVWELLAQFGLIDQRFFPAPSKIFSTMWQLFIDGNLLPSIGISMSRVLIGFLIGGLPGLVLGILMGISRVTRWLLYPLVAGTYPIPKTAILPLIVLIFGLGEPSKIVAVAIGVFYPVLINTMAGVLNIQEIYFDVGRNYGANRWNMFFTIALPGALPMIFTGLKLGAGIGLILLVMAEMIGAKMGIGYMIWNAWQIFAIPQMFVGLVVISVIGFAFTIILDALEHFLVPWKSKS